jgi:hemerythrin-like domain-containing protein
VCIVRTLSLSEHNDDDTVGTENLDISIKADERRVKRFQEVLRMKTISFTPERISPNELKSYVQFIRKGKVNLKTI